MTTVTEAQATWLRVVYELGVSLGRLPTTTDLAKACGWQQQTARRHIRRAAAAGIIEVGPRSTTNPMAVRIAPHALVQIGVPIVAYLAWPFGSAERGQLIGQWLAGLGVSVISPYLVASQVGHGRMDAVGISMALRSDAVLVWTDPLLVGRSDVSAAAASGIPVSVVRPTHELLVTCAADLWRPPLLQPAQ